MWRACVIGAALALAPWACGADADVASREAGCRACHTAQAAAFERSPHARAATSAVYRALRVARAGQAAYCDTCHRPAIGGEEGLGCVSCHLARGTTGARNGQLHWDVDGAPAAARAIDAPHALDAAGFLRSAELCGTCHEVEGPGRFREYPLSSWRASPAAARGEACASCHLPRVDTTTHDHALVGFDEAAARARLAEVITLAWAEDAFTVESHLDAHALPAGAAFFRGLWLEVGDERGPRAQVPLADRVYRGDEEVFDPLSADRTEAAALGPLEVRVVPLPAGLGARTYVRLWASGHRPELSRALGMTEEEATLIGELVR